MAAISVPSSSFPVLDETMEEDSGIVVVLRYGGWFLEVCIQHTHPGWHGWPRQSTVWLRCLSSSTFLIIFKDTKSVIVRLSLTREVETSAQCFQCAVSPFYLLVNYLALLFFCCIFIGFFVKSSFTAMWCLCGRMPSEPWKFQVHLAKIDRFVWALNLSKLWRLKSRRIYVFRLTYQVVHAALYERALNH